MIDHTTLLTYCAIVLGFVFIPGPATLLTVARAMTSGAKVGVATGAGITAGDIVHTFFAVVGISAVIATSAWLFGLLKYAGAAYLVYMGIKAILAKAPASIGHNRSPITAKLAFRQAIVTEILNPKTALFFLAFLPQFVHPQNGAVFFQLTILGVLFATIGFISTFVFAITAGHLGQFLRRHPSVLRWQGKFVGGIYCALGVRLALQERA
ncbi:LysE family translocator [Rhizobium leucaenae]|uniref:Threonine/homoserine/homoserine lactone efflux protein n=1 Tax=Rhizobium leucaenae TaxID=29450 RepID=A0A7W7ENA7_9HYPH|nr:LysE family translocator [Rhizobium leucaenae]MBB4571379.1 threonine/homoserine/homoserine lactone efflux protein [Rhizobium leucaenae]MBB6305231.1 threonine/homoserine/homoserine lactone efflux protein [Rhizobium leucaenae]